MWAVALTMGLPVSIVRRKGAVLLADVGPEHVAARAADGLVSRDAGDPLGRPVEGGDPPVAVDREHALVDGIEDRDLSLENVACLHRHGLPSR